MGILFALMVMLPMVAHFRIAEGLASRIEQNQLREAVLFDRSHPTATSTVVRNGLTRSEDYKERRNARSARFSDSESSSNWVRLPRASPE